MKLRDIDKCARALPGVTCEFPWGDDHPVYKVGGKMFAATSGKPSDDARLSFKCSDLSFELLTKKRGIEPAPYLARAKWVILDNPGALEPDEIKARLAEAHRMVAEKLPKKTQARLFADAAPAAAQKASPKKSAPKKAKR